MTTKIYCKLCGDTGWHGFDVEGHGHVVEKCRGPSHLGGEIMKLAAGQNPNNPDVQRLTAEGLALLRQYSGDDEWITLPTWVDEKRRKLWDAAVKAFCEASDAARPTPTSRL
jgi:hypothetical protein